MNREAVIEFVLKHTRLKTTAASTTTNAWVTTWCLSDDSLLACLAWYEAEDWLDQVYDQACRLLGLGLR